MYNSLTVTLHIYWVKLRVGKYLVPTLLILTCTNICIHLSITDTNDILKYDRSLGETGVDL